MAEIESRQRVRVCRVSWSSQSLVAHTIQPLFPPLFFPDLPIRT